MRVRGLKLKPQLNQLGGLQSHPIRVRGLKLAVKIVGLTIDKSHPIRVRGLKPHQRRIAKEFVKSHPIRVRGLKRQGVCRVAGGAESHPIRMRGLKQPYLRCSWLPRLVAPCIGVRIEFCILLDKVCQPSHHAICGYIQRKNLSTKIVGQVLLHYRIIKLCYYISARRSYRFLSSSHLKMANLRSSKLPASQKSHAL